MDALSENIKKFYWNYHITKEFLEVRNISRVASIIIESALLRQESRACHFMEDFPDENEQFSTPTFVKKSFKNQ